MNKNEIAFYEASNDIVLRWKWLWYNLILSYILKIDFISDFISTRLANRINRKWDRYLEMKKIGDFINNSNE